MTRRKIVFYNDLNSSYIVSEEYNGDKAEMEHFDLGSCDHNWPEFLEMLRDVSTLPDFLKTMSKITASYHATINGVLLPCQINSCPGDHLPIAHSRKELFALTGSMDEVWEVLRGVPGARLLDVSAFAPQAWNGKEVLDEDEFSYEEARPGDYVTQAVVDDAIDCLPPVRMKDSCSQMGEPHSIKFDERTGKWRNTYATFRKVGGEYPNGIWEYCGHCFAGETKEPK